MGKPNARTQKATFTLDVGLVTRLNAAASLRGHTRDALVTAAIEEACKGIVLWDKAKKPDRSEGKDRKEVTDDVDNSDPQ